MENIKKASKVFRAINHKLRQDLYNYIKDNPGTNVTPLYKHFKLEQPVASQHLAILRQGKFVTTQKEGKGVKYFANEGWLKEVLQISEQLLK